MNSLKFEMFIFRVIRFPRGRRITNQSSGSCLLMNIFKIQIEIRMKLVVILWDTFFNQMIIIRDISIIQNKSLLS